MGSMRIRGHKETLENMKAHSEMFAELIVIVSIAFLFRTLTEFIGPKMLSIFITGPFVEESLKLAAVVAIFTFSEVVQNRKNLWEATLVVGLVFAAYEQIATYGLQNIWVILTRLISHPLYMAFGLMGMKLAESKEKVLTYYLVFSVSIHSLHNIAVAFVNISGKYSLIFSTSLVLTAAIWLTNQEETRLFEFISS